MTHTFVSMAFGFGLAFSVMACGGAGTPGGVTSSTEDGGAGPVTSSDTADSGGTSAPGTAVDAGPPTQANDGGDVAVSEGGAAPEGGASADAGSGQPLAHVAIPMYVDPDDSPSLWTQVYAAGASVGLLVMNPDNGPDPAVDSEYTTAISSAHAASQIIIGYVHSESASRAIADVEADVDTYYSQYPGIDGIFVDEVSDDASTVASYYAPLYAYIKAKAASVTVAINPGTMVDESFMRATDILLSFEDTYANFIDPSQNPPTPAWVKTYPASRFWNIVHTTPAANEADAIARALSANVGWVYVTAEGPDTAYQDIETGSYWTTELSLVTAH
jgi:hypothetical protein